MRPGGFEPPARGLEDGSCFRRPCGVEGSARQCARQFRLHDVWPWALVGQASKKMHWAIERAWRIRLLAVVICASAFLTASCGGGDTAAPQTTEPTTSVEPDGTDLSAALPKIRDDFELNFSSASWYMPPSTLSIEGSELVAHTDFMPDQEGRALATQLCNALNVNFVLSNLADYGLTGVTVYAQDDPVTSSSGGGTC
jgi:hypothetical protein